MKITDATISQLEQIAEQLHIEALVDEQLPEYKKYEFEKVTKGIIRQIIEAVKKPEVTEDQIGAIFLKGIKSLSRKGLSEMKDKQQIAKQLQEVVKVLDLDDEYRTALNLWPIFATNY